MFGKLLCLSGALFFQQQNPTTKSFFKALQSSSLFSTHCQWYGWGALGCLVWPNGWLPLGTHWLSPWRRRGRLTGCRVKRGGVSHVEPEDGEQLIPDPPGEVFSMYPINLLRRSGGTELRSKYHAGWLEQPTTSTYSIYLFLFIFCILMNRRYPPYLTHGTCF